MKKSKLIRSLLLFLWGIFSFHSTINSQEVVEYKGDTVVIISPGNLRTINSIIVEHEYNKKELQLYKEISLVDSVLISSKDSIIKNQIIIMNRKEDYYTKSINNLEKSLKKEKRKRHLFTGILSGVAVFLGILIVSK